MSLVIEAIVTAAFTDGVQQTLLLPEAQRHSLTEMLDILDEPAVGLHARDVARLNALLKKLRNKGNTVLVVEHDPDVMAIADHVVDIGPKAGTHGGEVVFEQGSVYVMDEPTTGLHLSDIGLLMGIIDRLVDARNTVILIEHHLDVIRQADWIIDLGPEGGSAGGEVLFEGPPHALKTCTRSITARFLL